MGIGLFLIFFFYGRRESLKIPFLTGDVHQENHIVLG